MSVREMVREVQREVLRGGMDPNRSADLLLKLTALIGNVDDEARDADMEYSDVLLVCMKSESAANRAKVVAETSPQYRRKREAHDLGKLVESLIGGLKYSLRLAEKEMQLSR